MNESSQLSIWQDNKFSSDDLIMMNVPGIQISVGGQQWTDVSPPSKVILGRELKKRSIHKNFQPVINYNKAISPKNMLSSFQREQPELL